VPQGGQVAAAATASRGAVSVQDRHGLQCVTSCVIDIDPGGGLIALSFVPQVNGR